MLHEGGIVEMHLEARIDNSLQCEKQFQNQGSIHLRIVNRHIRI